LLVALSTHAIFEGIALGLTNDMSATINIMMAILFHKGPEAISLGVSLSKNFKLDEEKKKAIRLLLIFSLTTPLGIGIGMLLHGSNGMIEILFSSIAGGTFIYIAASEVIVEEFSIPGNKWPKMVTFLLGAIIITCMWLIES
jgi:zinc transporter 1/2/3